MLTPTQLRNAPPDLSCPVRRTEKDGLSLCWFLWHLHTTLSSSVGITLRLYQALNLGQALFFFSLSVGSPPPPNPCAPMCSLVATSLGPAHAWQEEPQTCTLLHCRQNGLLAFRQGDAKRERGKKTCPISLSLYPPPHAPPHTHCTTEQTLMFTFIFFFSWQLYLWRLTCPFVFPNPFLHLLSFPSLFFSLQ